jgi:hypothetical protein
VQVWVFPLIFLGFAVLAGMWPFHTWAPTGHVAAPTAASMLLAGVVMKLGSYGCFRAAMLLFPQGLEHWKWWIAWIAVIGIVYGAGVALVQKDFKFIIGYSSVSHMGFVLLGLATLNLIGMSGAILQMFSHGIVASLLFAVVGRMVYDRTHTRQLDELGGLAKVIPFALRDVCHRRRGFHGHARIQRVCGRIPDSCWRVPHASDAGPRGRIEHPADRRLHSERQRQGVYGTGQPAGAGGHGHGSSVGQRRLPSGPAADHACPNASRHSF